MDDADIGDLVAKQRVIPTVRMSMGDKTQPPEPSEVEQQKKHRRRLLLRSVLVSVVTLAVVCAFVRLDVSSVRAMWANLNAFVVVLFPIPNLLRALRFRLLFGGAVSLRNLATAVFLHQFFAMFLPFKSGELALPLMVKADGVPMARTLACLVLARLQDLAAVTSLLVLALIVFVSSDSNVGNRFWALVGSAATLLVGLSAILLARQHFIALMSKVVVWMNVGHHDWIAARFREFDSGIREVSSGVNFVCLMLSVCQWIAMTAINLLICSPLVANVSLQTLCVLVIAVPLVAQLPIHGIAGIGTFQAIVVVLFGWAGMESSDALALSIVWQTVTLAMICMWTVPALIARQFHCFVPRKADD